MGIYRDLGRHPGVYRIVGSQIVARFPFGMLSIVLLLHIQHQQGDYTSAGIVLAAMSCGQAISGPLSSRLMGRFGMRGVLAATSLLCAALLLVIAFAQLPLAITAALAFGMGLSTPPVTPAVRTLYPRIVPPNELPALFSLDAIAQELIWVLGPVIAVFASAQFGTATGLCVAAGFLLVGGAWFVSTPAVGAIRIPRSKRSLGAVFRYPVVIITTAASLCFFAGFAAIEAGVVAALADPTSGEGHASIESGIVLGMFAVGSLVGGLLFGHRPNRPWSLTLRLLVMLAGTLASLVSLNVWWLSIALFIGGMGTAPTFAAISGIVAAKVKFSDTAEAFGWIGTGQLIGFAAGAAIAGVAIDSFGARGAILVAATLVLVAVAVAAATVRWLPDLKGQVLEPPPESGTVTIPLA